MKRATRIEGFGSRLRAISIHALVKRATVTHAQWALGVVISIHALVKRATRGRG